MIMGTTKETWGQKKGQNVRELSTMLGGAGLAIAFVEDWCKICKRLNPTAPNIVKQNEFEDRFKRLMDELPRG
jgi:thiol-disulfide isomerase/thioredoxin